VHSWGQRSCIANSGIRWLCSELMHLPGCHRPSGCPGSRRWPGRGSAGEAAKQVVQSGTSTCCRRLPPRPSSPIGARNGRWAAGAQAATWQQSRTQLLPRILTALNAPPAARSQQRTPALQGKATDTSEVGPGQRRGQGACGLGRAGRGRAAGSGPAAEIE